MNSIQVPYFSIILPVYNGEKFLGAAIESILTQSENDWELIIVDDASTDGSPQIVADYARRHPAIRHIRNEKNLHIAGSLNRGIEEARGNWIARLDSDDFFTPDYLKIMRRTIREKNENINYFFSCWSTIVDENSDEVLDVRLPNPDVILKMMPCENFLYHSGTCFSKEAWAKVDGYPKDRSMAEDVGMWLKFIDAGLKLHILQDHLIRYRIHQTNVTSMNDARLYQNLSTKNAKAMRQYHEWRISLFLKQKKLRDARSELRKLWDRQTNPSLKNLQYYFLTFMPHSVVHLFMWEIRPRLRSIVKNLMGRNIHV